MGFSSCLRHCYISTLITAQWEAVGEFGAANRAPSRRCCNVGNRLNIAAAVEHRLHGLDNGGEEGGLAIVECEIISSCPSSSAFFREPSRTIPGRCNQIRAQIEETTTDYDREKLQESLTKLASIVAEIHVGGSTEVEAREHWKRVSFQAAPPWRGRASALSSPSCRGLRRVAVPVRRRERLP